MKISFKNIANIIGNFVFIFSDLWRFLLANALLFTIIFIGHLYFVPNESLFKITTSSFLLMMVIHGLKLLIQALFFNSDE